MEEFINKLYPAERKYLINPIPQKAFISAAVNSPIGNWRIDRILFFYQVFIYPNASFYDKDIIALKFLSSPPKNCRIYLILLGRKALQNWQIPLQFSDNFFDGFSSFRIRRDITVDISA